MRRLSFTIAFAIAITAAAALLVASRQSRDRGTGATEAPAPPAAAARPSGTFHVLGCSQPVGSAVAEDVRCYELEAEIADGTVTKITLPDQRVVAVIVTLDATGHGTGAAADGDRWELWCYPCAAPK